MKHELTQELYRACGGRLEHAEASRIASEAVDRLLAHKRLRGPVRAIEDIRRLTFLSARATLPVNLRRADVVGILKRHRVD